VEDEFASPQDWSDDGRFLLYGRLNPSTRRDIWVLDVAATKSRAVVDSQAEERNAQFSPDGRWIVYETDASGRQFEVVVQAFPERGQVFPISHAGGTQARWSADSREISFLAPGGRMMAAPVTATYGKTPTIAAGKPVELFTTQIRESGPSALRPQYDRTPEGNFLVLQPVETPPLTVILKWAPGASK